MLNTAISLSESTDAMGGKMGTLEATYTFLVLMALDLVYHTRSVSHTEISSVQGTGRPSATTSLT